MEDAAATAAEKDKKIQDACTHLTARVREKDSQISTKNTEIAELQKKNDFAKDDLQKAEIQEKELQQEKTVLFSIWLFQFPSALFSIPLLQLFFLVKL